jgi:histidinol dehydrogenase
MRVLDWNALSPAQQAQSLQRPALRDAPAVAAAVRRIVDAVRGDGDSALLAFSEQFDGVRPVPLQVTPQEFDAAERALSAAQTAAVEKAIANVRRFHAAQQPRPLRIETSPGVLCERFSVPIRAVGLYVPAGSAPLPSTAIMLAVPADIAACPVRVMCTPPARDGTANPAVLVAARKSGVDQVFKVGGAQAIAAMAYGTASIPKCDKIFGPGNAWVTAAKLNVAQDPAGAAADLPAGVTEVLVIADDSARADFIAADLLAQAEHGPDAQALLITTSAALAAATALEVQRRVQSLSRTGILAESVKSMRIFVVERLETAFAIANDYAPEHLMLEIREPRRWLGRVSAAGAVFLGHWSPESVGDYCSGPNHTLPTYGYAKAHSGLSLEDFQKRITVQELSPPGLKDLGPTAQILAGLEGLDAHAAAVSVRLAAIEDAAGNAEVSLARPETLAVVFLARPEIVTLQAYAHAAWRPTLTRLHANEAPWRPAGDATSAGLNRYPEPQPELLIERLAELYGVPAGSVLATHGSDEAIDLLSRIYLRPGDDAILQCTPTFGMYQVAARIQGAAVIEVPLERERGWALDPARVLAAWQPNVKLVYLCSPNNPTANLLDAAALEELCKALDGKAIVVIDEAYIEWSRASSLSRWMNRFSTLAILRTLSKAHALAGARVGALLANPGLIQLAKRIIPPYSLAAPSVEAALRGLDPLEITASRARLETLLAEREHLSRGLAASPWVERVWPSDANFLLIDCRDADRFMRHSLAGGLIVRDLRAHPSLPQSLRVSVGTRAQNDALLQCVGAAAA